MNSRERVKLALDHREPDRIPLDFGGTVLTSLHQQAYRKLRAFLGLPELEIRIMDIFQQIAVIDEDVREKLGVDFRNLAPRSSATFRIEIQDDMPGYRHFHDEWGIGWRMPKDGGFFYDMFDHSLQDATSKEEIDNYPWPDPCDPARFEGLAERAKRVAEEEGQAVVLGGLAAGFMELTAWLRGYDKFYPDFVMNPDLLTYLMDKIIDLKLAYWEIALPLVGEYVDVVQEADDFAGQQRMLISPATYRKFCKPRHKRIFDFIKARTDAKIFFHSCGSIRAVIPDLIEVGVDILNPVQVSAKGMDSGELKKEFGQEVTFWGGLVDTQGVLGNGTPGQVRDEVKRRIEDFAPGGGFVAATVHNIQANVPPENIVALFETLQEHAAY